MEEIIIRSDMDSIIKKLQECKSKYKYVTHTDPLPITSDSFGTTNDNLILLGYQIRIRMTDDEFYYNASDFSL